MPKKNNFQFKIFFWVLGISLFSNPYLSSTFLSAWENVDKKDYGQSIASTLYFSYLNTNLLADAFATGQYSKEEVKSHLSKVDVLLKENFSVLEKISKTPSLTSDEAKNIGKLIELLLSIQNQNRYLSLYTEKKDSDSLNKFHQNRKRAKEIIKEILKI